ncbi:MAG: RidA family protein [Bryobacteraceae bacterium]|nr:RidA family protein [Bryobacteraceae bacterium]
MIRTSTSFILLLLSTASLAAAEKQVVQPKEFATGRPFSPGILANGTLYVAGQIGQDLKTGKMGETFEDEVKLTLQNIGVILKEAGYDYQDAVSVTVYLTDISLFNRMNAIYVPFFPEPRPVRATVAVAKLVGTAQVEISLTAWKDPKGKGKGKRKAKN